MIRYFLAKGDRGGSAVIIEGLETMTYSNPPPSVNIATLYMKTYCSACNQEGFISPTGVRWPGTASNGQPWALSGDINVCGCNPPPIFYAERNMVMVFESHEIAMLEAAKRVSAASVAMVEEAPGAQVDICASFDEQVRVGIGTTIPRSYPYLIEMSNGRTVAGRVNSNGLLPRIHSERADSYTIYWGEDALLHKGWT
ncbi:PAAR domain-containing protein [Burkholderia multivorans]|uniref:PAAR domain-containing protein n=1 Tax=Burkholderia multivorans TaxID=87883 RepID=UPI0020136F8C|nr:PAAR domain-containing protein [Burkholderia multivorans]